jgi:tight adherence protein C
MDSQIPIMISAIIAGGSIGGLTCRIMLQRIEKNKFQRKVEWQKARVSGDLRHGRGSLNKLPLWITIGLLVAPADQKEIKKLKLLLSQVGFRSEQAMGAFFVVKYSFCLLALAIAVGLWYVEIIPMAFVPTIAAIAILLPDKLLVFAARRRLRNVDEALPDFIDLSNISMTAGLSWFVSIRRVSHDLAPIYPDLCDEFNYLSQQIEFGVSRRLALEQLAERNPSKSIRHLVYILIQSERMGSSVVSSLKDFSERIYQQREQSMEEKAGMVSAKMAFITMPFLLLPFVVILIGEQAVNLWRALISMGG